MTMKHFDLLTELESSIIKLKTFSNTVTVIANGAETSSTISIQDSLYHIDETLDDIVCSLRWNYDQLFEAIRSDKSDDVEYDFDGIEQVVNSWQIK